MIQVNSMHEQSWKNRITRFLGAQSLSLLGSAIVQYAIVWHIALETSSGMMMTIATIVAFVPQIIISPFAGVLLDRYNRKAIIMISDTLIAIATLILFVAMNRGYTSLPLIFTTMMIRSSGAGVQMPAVNAVVPQLVGGERLMRINSIYATLVSIMTFASAAIAAVILAQFGLKMTLLVDVFTALAGVAITATVYFPPLDQSDAQEISGIEEFKQGIAYLRTHPFAKRLLSYQAFILFLISPVFLIPIIAQRSLGGEVFHLAAIEGAYGIGAIIGGVLIALWGGFKNRMTTVILTSVCFGILMVGMGFASFYAFATLVFIWGIIGPSFDTSFITSLQERVEPDMHGRVFSFMQIAVASALPLGMIVFGPLADVVSIESIFMVTGASVVACAAFGKWGLRLERV